MPMLKLIGAVLILFSGTMLGLWQAEQLSGRPRQIRQLVQVLQKLETEIVYGQTPLSEAIVHAAKGTAAPLSEMLATVAHELRTNAGTSTYDIWQETTNRYWPFTHMKAAEKEIWLQFGQRVGASDREDQIKHIRLAMHQLKQEEDEARDEATRFSKLWKSLGLLAAALIVILMY
jgi:stage III sporulation protein AB